MKIIIVGCGKVGYVLAKTLSAEQYTYLTIIDNKSESLEKANETIDAMLIKGDGLNVNTLSEAGVRDADLIIAVTDTDEKNILCCISAKHLGVKYTIARVRTPEYALDDKKTWKNLGLDLIINPESETAREISRLLRFPVVDDIDIIVGGRVELIAFNVSEVKDFFVGKSMSQIFYKRQANILLVSIERSGGIIIPHGDFVFQKDDSIRVLGRPSDIMNFFHEIGKDMEKTKNVLIIGGGRITYYLVELLHRHSGSLKIKIIETDREKCEELCVRFPRCTIINGDGTDEDVLTAEISDTAGAIVCLTNKDEENTIIGLYSLHLGIKKVIVKINHINRRMISNLKLGSIISPRNITSDQIIHYIRGLSYTTCDVKVVHTIFDNGIDTIVAAEIDISNKAKCLMTPLKDLKIKSNILIGCIIRNSNIIIPTGLTQMQIGDCVIVVAKNDTINDLNDIFQN